MPAKKEWTIVFLVSAKSNLYYEMITAINEIYSVGSSDDINFIIIYDGPAAGKFLPEFTKPSIYYADAEIPFLVQQPLKIYPEHDLTNSSNLAEMLEYCITQFPAGRYGFVYKGHGGPGQVDINNGLCIEKLVEIPKYLQKRNSDIDIYVQKKFSEGEYHGYFELKSRSENMVADRVLALFVNKDARILTHNIIKESLDKVFNTRKKLGFVFMDCCWAMQVENAYAYRGLTGYYIASADEMPALGVGYVMLCRKLVDRPHLKTNEIADMLVSVNYVNKYDDYDSDNIEFQKMGVSLTSVKTGSLSLFIKEFTTFCSILLHNMEEMHILLAEARAKCYDFTYTQEDVYGVYNIDLIWFLENMIFLNRAYSKNTELELCMQNMVRILMLYIRSAFLGSNYKDAMPGKKLRVCRGITITFPKKADSFADLKDGYNQISEARRNSIPFYKDTKWPEVLVAYFNAIEQNKKDLSKMKDDIRNKASRFLKKYGSRDITIKGAEINEDEYSKYFKDAEKVDAQSRWGHPKNFRELKKPVQ